MNTMDTKDKEIDIENLTRILSQIQILYNKKKEHLDDLKLEISELREILKNLNNIISNKSFHSAEELYLEKLKDMDLEKKMENYFDTKISKEKVQGTTIKRKVFSDRIENEGDLLCVLNFFDLSKVEIKFLNPEASSIKETSEKFIKIFLKGALINIKERIPELTLEYEYFKNSDIIEKIKISNLRTINDYDLITDKIHDLLTSNSLK